MNRQNREFSAFCFYEEAGRLTERLIPDWERIQALLAEAVFNGYVRGLKDFRDNTISFESLQDETNEMKEMLKKHYFE